MKQLEKISANLIRRGFETAIFPTGKEAAQFVLEMVAGCSVGYGGSITCKTLGLFDSIGTPAHEVYTHLPGRAGEDERKALLADIFLSSANALSMDGHIVNIDGTGNRIAATSFGPRRVVYLIGKNKIVPTLHDALLRAKEAAVAVARHYKRKTPCVTTGKCEDCLSPDCVCSITTIHRKCPAGLAASVLLINEDLGF
jgi:hypothetical protein